MKDAVSLKLLMVIFLADDNEELIALCKKRFPNGSRVVMKMLSGYNSLHEDRHTAEV